MARFKKPSSFAIKFSATVYGVPKTLKLLLVSLSSLLNTPRKMHKSKLSQNFYTIGRNNELKNTENIALTDPEKFLKQISNVADIYGTAIKIVDKNGNDRIIYSSNLASRDFYFRSVGLTKTSTGTYIEFIAADDKKYKLLVDDIL